MYEFEEFYPTRFSDSSVNSKNLPSTSTKRLTKKTLEEVLVYAIVFSTRASVTVEQKDTELLWGDIVLIRSNTDSAKKIVNTHAIANVEFHNGQIVNQRSPMYEYVFSGTIPLEGLPKAPLLSKLPNRVKTGQRFREDSSNFLILRSLDKHLKNTERVDISVVFRLVDLLVNLALKDYFRFTPVDQGLAALYRHPTLSRVVNLVQKNPEQDWNITGLAKCAGLSRSSLCARFKNVSGFTVFEFITSVRMQRAWSCLCNGEPVCKVSEKVGYLSEPSFNRAFKKTYGETAASVRRRHLV